MLQNNLTPNDSRVFQYVNEHPGSSQEQVVRGMNSDPSRLTVINILEKLEEYDMVLFKKDKPNSQIYRIYVNNNNLLVAVEQSLSEFQHSFFVLLDHLKSKIDERYIERAEVKGRDIDPVLSDIWKIHQWAIHGLMLPSLRTGWTHQAQDKESLHRLYYLVFNTMMEIEYSFTGFLDHLEEKKIDYHVNLGMDKGYDPGVHPPRFSPPVFVTIIPSNIDWGLFKDWGLMKEARDLGKCLLKLFDLRKKAS